MRDREIDEILKRAAGASPDVDPALVDRISGAIGSSLGPVRPLPPVRVLASGLFFISGAVALAGAARLGLHGIARLSGPGIALIFPVLAVLTWLAALAAVAEMTPGGRRPATPAFLLAGGSTLLVAVFALLFHDYRMDGFVPRGIACLTAGLLHAVPTGVAGWLVVRRGFAVNRVAAGLAMGTLAGLAGVTMLELHCANFEAPHVMVWHTAVIPISGLAGAPAGWAARSWRAGRRAAAPQ